MEEMGMTDNQWKDNLRSQLENWEEVEELLDSGKTEDAKKKIEKIKARIKKAWRIRPSERQGRAGLPPLPHQSKNST